MSSEGKVGAEQKEEDLAEFVENLLKDMQKKFDDMSGTVVNKIEEMGKKIDELEGSINQLLKEAEADPSAGEAKGSPK